MSSFARALATGPVVLDGGLGTLLEARGNDLSSALWSARLLRDDPDEVRAAHAEYFRAGARVAITASYQVSAASVADSQRGATDVEDLLVRSVELARAARDDVGRSPADAWIAASVGPYGAALADGSEYTGDYDIGTAALRAWHRPRLQALASARPDVLAVETIPALAEVEAVVAELSGLGVPAWICVTIESGALRSGDSMAEAFAIAAGSEDVIAIGVNCCDVEDVDPALAIAASVTDKPLVAYPNSGERWHSASRTWSGRAGSLAERADAWIDLGARLVGGCCRVGPDQIAAMAERIPQGGPDGGQGTSHPAKAF